MMLVKVFMVNSYKRERTVKFKRLIIASGSTASATIIRSLYMINPFVEVFLSNRYNRIKLRKENVYF